MIWRKKEKKKAQYQFNSERVFLVATQPAKTAYSYFQTSSVGLSEEEMTASAVNTPINGLMNVRMKSTSGFFFCSREISFLP